MKKFIILIPLLLTSMCSIARDDVTDYLIEEAMQIPKISSAIGSEVKFYFAGQEHNQVEQKIGEFKSNKKTNAFGISDKEACQWVFASAMKSLHQRAIKEGGNAVINIRSNYKGTISSSPTTFKCGAGAIMAGVALIGDIVKLQQK